MLAPILTKMVGLEQSWQIWKRLEVYYASQTRAKVKKLKVQLRMITKDKSISEYLLAIKKIVDSLAAIGSAISNDDHIEAILDGLPEDYDSFVTFVTSCLDPYTADDIEALLLAQEEHFEKHKKADSNLILANTASGPSYSFGKGRVDNSKFRGEYNNRGGRSNFRGGYNSNRGGRYNNGRGNDRSNWGQNSNNSWNQNNRPQCQICGKPGHLAIDCWYRFN